MEKQATMYAIPVAIIAAGALIAGGLAFGLSNISTPSPATTPQQQPQRTVDISKVNIMDEPFIGNPKAPVTVAYWYDYQCPFCKRTEEETMPSLINEYVKAGKVKIVYKDFQFLGQDSQTAGLAGRAVWEVAPDKFSEWHKTMYDKQDNENSGWGNKDDILAMTKTIPGIDADKVAQLMTSKASEYQKAMDADKAEGSGFGVQGTPAFIIGKQLIEGAQPYTITKQAIDLALQGK